MSVEVKVRVPLGLWARLRDEIRRRYGKLKGNVSKALLEAVQLWLENPQVKSERGKVKNEPSFFISDVEREAFRAFALHKVSKGKYDPSKFRGYSYSELRDAWERLKRKLGFKTH